MHNARCLFEKMIIYDKNIEQAFQGYTNNVNLFPL